MATKDRSAKLATPMVYPYVAEPPRELAPRSSWPFARTRTQTPPKRKPNRKPNPLQAPRAAGPTEPPPAPQLPAPTPRLELIPAVPAAAGGETIQPVTGERVSRARIVERLWEDPIREPLEVNLGATTESNLYVDLEMRVANGGVLVATYRDLPPGTQVRLHITLAGAVTTHVHGRVTLKRESLPAFGDPAPGVCVAFELLSNEALALLEQFASMRTPWVIEDE